MSAVDDFDALDITACLDGDCKYYSALQYSNIIRNKMKNELAIFHFNIL